ncbi:hypothetical protein EC912_101278 [Luteibacter rhizovicinus]|uniref:Uncharacterized protein n=1 Tax=Luteibacter rhizovicinus TaxID=242606 RepID=A0A4R3YZF2_9GAMM|nr:hypothetical protein [Luteibacter rhizovicinus]TCV97278.1 hypothetical protein EC912_101278 [Luteibacter rhizovicinus]
MEDRTYLLGKVAALEAALKAAMATHPEPEALIEAVSLAMTAYTPDSDPVDIRSFAEGWMAIVTPLLTDQALRDSYLDPPERPLPVRRPSPRSRSPH